MNGLTLLAFVLIATTALLAFLLEHQEDHR